MSRQVTFRPRADSDLDRLHQFIERDSPTRAHDFTERIRRRCASLSDFPEQGTPRDDLGSGLRVLGFERRVTIAFRILPDRVQIVTIFYAGRNIEQLLQQEFQTNAPRPTR